MSSLLLAALLTPLLGAGAIALANAPRRPWLAVGVTALSLILALAVALPFYPRGSWQAQLDVPWLASLGIGFRLGLDGLGLHGLLLTYLLAFAAAVAALGSGVRERLTLVPLVLAQAGAGLAFAATDLVLFLVGTQLALGAVAAGLARRAPSSAATLRLFTGFAGALVLVALLVLYLLNGSDASVVLLHQNHPAAVAPIALQRLLFGVLAVGFAAQMPLTPWHPWLLDALEELPAPLAAMLVGAVAPLGVFGLIRYGLAAMPGPAADLAPALLFFGLVSLGYGLWGALATTSRRRIACVAMASAGATVAGLGAFQAPLVHPALVLLALSGAALPAWILAADAWPRQAPGRKRWLVAAAVLAALAWPLATSGILGGFASSFTMLVGL